VKLRPQKTAVARIKLFNGIKYRIELNFQSFLTPKTLFFQYIPPCFATVKTCCPFLKSLLRWLPSSQAAHPPLDALSKKAHLLFMRNRAKSTSQYFQDSEIESYLSFFWDSISGKNNLESTVLTP
jgi:hypothetical protein